MRWKMNIQSKSDALLLYKKGFAAVEIAEKLDLPAPIIEEWIAENPNAFGVIHSINSSLDAAELILNSDVSTVSFPEVKKKVKNNIYVCIDDIVTRMRSNLKGNAFDPIEVQSLRVFGDTCRTLLSAITDNDETAVVPGSSTELNEFLDNA
jgi:hypothetical protein